MRIFNFALVCLLIMGCSEALHERSDVKDIPDATEISTVMPPNSLSGERLSALPKDKERDVLTGFAPEEPLFYPQVPIINVPISKTKTLEGFKIEDILWDQSPIGKMLSQTVKKSDVFTFTPSETENITIQAREGSIFTIAPHTFADKNGNPITAPITLEVKECFSISDMLSSHLTTSCGDMPIETAGMFYLHATSKGEPVILRKTQPILVEIPAQKQPDPKMQLFYGDRSRLNGRVDWRVAPRETNLNYKQSGNMEKSTREVFKDYEKRFDLGSIELQFMIKTDLMDVLQEPEIKVIVSDMNPLLNPYKSAIETVLSSVDWTDRLFSPEKNNRAMNTFDKEIGLGKPIFASKEALMKIREELQMYKNISIKKQLPLVARMNKDFYYSQINLAGDYALNLVAWEKDMKFFSSNFQVLKEKGDDYLSAMIEAFNLNRDKLIDGYTAKYANSYLFATNQLGWGNCDRFISFPEGTVPLMVKSESPNETDVKVVLKDRSVILGMDKTGSMFTASALPKNQLAMIIATRTVNGYPQFAFRELKIGENFVYEMNDFKTYTFGELQDKIEAYRNLN